MGRRKSKPLSKVLPELRDLYRYFRKDIRQKSGLVAGSFAALLAGVVFQLLEPWPLKFVLDEIIPINPQTSESTIRLPQSWSTGQMILFLAVAVIVIAVGRAAMDFISRVGFFKVGNYVIIRVRDRVYRHLQALPMSFHDRARHGDLITRIIRDVNLLRDVAATAMLPLIGSTMLMAGMAIVMLILNWQLAILSLIIVPLYWLSTVRLGRQIKKAARKQREREGAMAAIASEAMSSIQAIKALQLEDKFAGDFDRKNNQSQSDDLKSNRLSLKLARTVDILLAIATACVLYVGTNYVLNGTMRAGELVVFLIYLKRSFKPAQEFAKYTARIAKATAAGERVIHLLQQPVEPQRKEMRPMGPVSGDIEFEDVTFGYDNQQLVLKDFNLRIQAGTTLAITGPSGIGKSSLFNLLLGFYSPKSGRVLVDGIDITQCSLKSWRAQFGVVLQNPLLFAASIRENIAVGIENASDESIIRAARLAEVDEFVMQMPRLYDTPIGERSATLSSGQRQRIAIARAALNERPILLLDEPTTGLDEMNQAVVSEALLELAAGKTTLMITHNLNMASRADQIVYLVDGQVAEQGTFGELLELNGHFAQLYRQQRLNPKPASGRPVPDADNETGWACQ